MTKTIKGVNLGGWLVLEPWITPGLFKDIQAQDEFTYCETADRLRLKRLSHHRKTWITRQDFKWLAGQGIEAVRIPVGYWAFGDVQPYQGTIEYLDSAFAWAEEFGLKILVCLHGAPGSQNGEMHSGRKGDIMWHHEPANIDLSLNAIERLATRYAGRPSLLGVEMLNEPSNDIPKSFLKDYYRQGYKITRRVCGRQVWAVFGDYLHPKPRSWSWSLHWPFHRLACLDNHQYQIFAPQDKALDVEGHLRKTNGPVARLLRLISWHRHIIIGEWSAALDPMSLKGLNAGDLDDAYRRYIQAQLEAYSQTVGWFYWTYRTENGGPWSFRELVERGVFPKIG